MGTNLGAFKEFASTEVIHLKIASSNVNKRQENKVQLKFKWEQIFK
jgi:hypothetical protein